MDIQPSEALEQKLAALEAAEPTIPAPIREQADAPQDTQPTAPTGDVPETPVSKPADAQPAADKPPIDATKDSPQKGRQANGNVPSPFTQNADRFEKSWKGNQQWSEKNKADEARLKEQEQAIAQREARLTQERAKLHQKAPPEQFETEARNLSTAYENTKADAQRFADKAKKLEDDGDFKGAAMAEAKAEELRELASFQKGKAKEFKDYADNLRKNPPADVAQIEQQQALALQHYTLEAAKKWPDLGVNGSELQKTVVQSEQVLAKAGIDVRENPVLRYYVAEFAAANAAAGRVPAMEKELGQLRAKVKELELATTPGGGNPAIPTPKGDAAPSHEDEGAALRQMAIERGSIR